MKSSSKNRSFLPISIIVLLGLLVTLSATLFSPQAATAVSDPAITAVQQAWDNAHSSNTFTFDTHIEQTSYPLPSLSNVGRQPQTDNLFLTGQRDQAENSLEMTLWQNARGSVENGMSVRSQDGRTFRRTSAGEWEEQNELGDLFAPGSDPLTFLQTATNITALGADTRELGGLTFTYEKYSFDLDTTAYARVLREQLDAQLAQFGTLPAGMRMETPEIYRKMSGQGELWLDEAGLPHRLEMTLTIPPQGNNGKVVAQITTDLSGFDMAQIEATAVPIWQSPQTWWQTHQVEVVAGTQQVGKTAVFLFIGIGLVMLFLAYWRSRRFYATVASVLVMSMLFSPLLQVAQASGFQNNLQAAQDKAETRQAEAEVQADLQTEFATTNWNPNENPLSANASTLALAPALASSNTITDTTDTDGDGLIDLDEAYWGTCPYIGAPDGCTGVTDATDTDGDNLSDGIEVHDLGTDPDNPDTDFDGINDDLEVAGFFYAGETWYLNPLEEDSNKDGVIDGMECRARTNTIPSEFDPFAICPDTDADNVPDLFDNDNDGDGVEDAYDASPFTVSAVTYDEDNPLQLSIDNLAVGKPVFVDFQLQPQTATNLNLYNHVLDWPSNDYEGQIQRTINSTWADTDNLDLRSNAANAANGDIRLVPMLEITMPYTNGHYANLPITTTAPLTRNPTDDIDSWLDASQLEPFSITVNDVDDVAGELNAYVPLTQVRDRYGTPQAFAARMLYRPSQGTNGRATWGAAQEVRLIWFVQMITDACPDGYDDTRQEENGTITYACIDPNTGATAVREDVLTIGHIYPETWQLTGLTISEEHDFDMAILYEDPALDPDLTADDQLLVSSWNMNNSFLNGRDCDSIDGNGDCQGNGQRDVTVENLSSVSPNWFSGANYLHVDTYLNYEHGAYFAYLVGTEVAPLLESKFGSYTDVIPTLLYAQDHTNRKLSLDSIDTAGLVTEDGHTLRFDLKPADVPLQTTSSMNWTPYQYVAGQWQAADIESYLTSLDSRLQNEGYFQPEDQTEAATEEAELRRTWVQLYYASLWQGLSALTELGTLPLHARTSDPDIPEAAYEPLILPGTDFGAVLLAFAFLDIFIYGTPQNAQTQYSFRWVSSSASATAFGVAVLITWAAMALILYGMISGDEAAIRQGQVILAVVNIVVVSVYAINALNAIRNAASAASVAASNSVTSYVSMAPVGLAIGLSIIWGLFIFQATTSSMTEVGFNIALSLAIATTIVTIALFITSLLGLGIIGILLSLVDSIFVLLNKKGPTQYVVEFLAQSFYAIDSSFTNLDSGDRLEIAIKDIAFVNAADGFRTGRDLHITTVITNRVSYNLSLASDVGTGEITAHNTFTYTLQPDQIPHHDGLQFVNDWYGDQWTPDHVGFRTSSENAIDVTLPAAGMNQGLELYYTESFRTGYYTCWRIVVEVSCDWHSFSDSAHIPLVDTLVFDVFPETVSGFAQMNWEGAALSFPEQLDFDGDGLSAQQGTDPDDTGFDTDGDGLSDLYEITNGYTATAADGDFDGLNDKEELFYGTNPFVADTDGDGLNDRIETVEGWLVVYNGNQITRVWSDPLSVDIDEDGLSDRDEFIFGFNPWVATDPSRILNLVQFDDLGIVEMGAPDLLLQFEDAVNSTAFYDSSKNGHHGLCTGTSCPSVNGSGRYAQSLSFDGIDDVVTIPDTDDINLGTHPELTISLWFQVDDATINSRKQVIYEQGGATRGLNLYVYNGQLYGGGWNTAESSWTGNYINTPVSSGQWHHAALVLNGTAAVAPNALTLYVDGQLVGTVAGSQLWAHTPTSIGARNDATKFHDGNASGDGDYLAGRVDELAIFNRALTVDEVADVINGRYNPNDNLLAPGADLTYQAIVTNTSSVTASGFLIGENSTIEPEISYPDAAFSFEPSQRQVNFTNSVGDENNIICIDAGTCPTAGVDGKIRNAIAFDGVDDAVIIPNYGQPNQIHFWLWVDSRPAAGQVAAILDTADELPYDFDILLNDSGKILLAVDGVVQYTSNNTVPNGSWRHISYNGFYLYIDGNPDGAIQSIAPRQIGYGRFGNNAAGTTPFHGRLDEFLSMQVEDGSGGGVSYNEIQDEIMPGNYYYTTNSGAQNHFPVFLYRFDELITYDGSIFYDSQANSNHAVCHPEFNTCPDLTTATGGYNGRAVIFDGVGDYLEQPGLFTAAEATIRMYINPAAYPAAGKVAYLYDGADVGSGNTLTFDLYMDENGRLTVDYGSGTQTYNTVVPLNQWSQIEVIYDRFFNGSAYEYAIYLDVNTIRDSAYAGICAGSGTCSYTVRVSNGRIGDNIPWDGPFNGMMDQLELGAASYDFDPPIANVGYDNLANEVRAAACNDVLACPSVGNGRYDQGLVFDGEDDWLDLGFVLNPAVQPFAASLWFNATTVSNRPVIMQQIDGSGAGRVWFYLESDGTLRTFLGGSSLAGTTPVSTNTWHHAAVTYDGTTLRLYLDGVLENAAVRTMEASDGNLWLGRQKTSSTQYWAGDLDELVIVPGVVLTEGVQLLMNSTWPIIDVTAPFIPFTSTALSSQVVSGDAPVSPYATTSRHRFDQEVEAALVLQAQIDYPVIDDNAANISLFIPFEEGPGSTVFDNLISYSNPSSDPNVEASCNGDSCPTAGLRGQVERAAYFDGLDDYLTMDFEPIGTDYGPEIYSIAAWVKAEQGTILSTYQGGGGIHSYELQLDVGQLTTIPSSGDAPVSTSFDAPRNEWFHLAVTLDGSNVARIYVNGVEVTTGTHKRNSGFKQLYLGVDQMGQDFLQGYLDDLRLYNITLSPANVQALYQKSAPLMRFEFDEDEGATQFTDNSINQYIGQPQLITADVDGESVTQLNPVIGTPGRIGNGIVLDGTGYVQVPDATNVGSLTNDLTIMGWIKPTTVTQPQRILSAGRSTTSNGFGFGLYADGLIFTTYGIKDYKQPISLEANLWQHVVVTLDSANDAHFFVNGEFVGTIAHNAPGVANLDDPLYIGVNRDTDGTFHQYFNGQIDELVVYGREMATAEIHGIYLRELRWYRDKATTYLTVDTDNPTIELLSDTAYWPNGYIQLAVGTTDATSAVTLLDFGLKAPGESEFSWQGAPSCAESNDNGAAWCPSFDSTLFGGEGAYEMQFRAVDMVGNETLSSIYTLYVDGTPPTVLLDYSGASPIPGIPIDDLRWQITFQGSLADPDLSGTPVPPTAVAGSGVMTNTVLVQLIDQAGGVVSGLPQVATITGTIWAIDYVMSGMVPQGTYTVIVTLEDEVGNQATIDTGIKRLDTRLPDVDLYDWTLPEVISQTLPFFGTLSALPEWGSNVVEHHFEEAAGATLFYNTTGSHFYTVTHSVCTACPTARQPSLFSRGVAFDGVDDAITIPYVTTTTLGAFSAAVWFRVTDLASTRTILQQEDGNGSGRSWLMLDGGTGLLSTYLGGSLLVSSRAVAPGKWVHAAVTYDGEILRLYLNGRLEAAAARTLESSEGNWLLGINKSGVNHFRGMMDEFNLYDRALAPEEVYGLAQWDSSAAILVKYAFEPFNAAITETTPPPPNAPTWNYATSEDAFLNFTPWQATVPAGLEGLYELYLVDYFAADTGIELAWRGLIDMVSPVITATGRLTWQNGMAVTEYSFIFNDFLLDETSYQHPCAVGEWVTESYNDTNLPHDGQPYEASGICQVATHETSRDFTACDAVGHCTTVTVTPADLPQICDINENQTYDFEDLSIFIEPGGLGDIACLQVGHVAANHPAATAGIRTDSYWIIEALNSSDAAASNFAATLTMTVPFIPDTNDKLCRYTGSSWDCKANSFNAGNNTITRNNVTEFSPWAVGNDVGPTAVSLHSVSASSATPLWIVVILLLMMWGITAILWRRRQLLVATTQVRKR